MLRERPAAREGDSMVERGRSVYSCGGVTDRGEKLDDVLAKSDGLRTTADAFHRTARRLRSRMWWANVRTALAVFLIALAGVVIIFFAACGGVRCVT